MWHLALGDRLQPGVWPTPTSIVTQVDGIVVPGNRHLTAAERELRATRYYWPYHRSVEAQAERLGAQGAVPGNHSDSQLHAAHGRGCAALHVGVLWNEDSRLARPLIAALGAEPALVVGDNEPYSGSEPEGYALATHGAAHRRPHVEIEIRQDEIDTAAGAARWAGAARPRSRRTCWPIGGCSKPPLLRVVGAIRAGHSGPPHYHDLNAGTTEQTMDAKTRTELEAAAFRRLVHHFRERSDLQNIDLMNLAGFCRNCLSKWYRAAAAERGVELSYEAAREIVYGMTYQAWKSRHQAEATDAKVQAYQASLAEYGEAGEHWFDKDI